MNILYVITGLGLGGAERVVVDLADEMTNLGNTVVIAYLTGEIVVRPKNKDIELISLNLNSITQLYKVSRKYRKLVRDFKPDVVHAHMIHANIFARLNRIGCPVPKLICTAHNSNEGGKVRMIAYRFTNFLSNYNTNVSSEATEALINKGAFTSQNLKTIYNGIDLKKFNLNYDFDKEDKIVFLTVGRFNKQKDYPNLLRAIYLFKQEYHKDFIFYIVGDGELKEQIVSLIEELNLCDCVKLLGKRSDIPLLMNKADYFVLASEFEGFGLVIAEAMACGTFVVSTDSGGVAEVMGETGILVPIKNSELLSKALLSATSLSEEKINTNRFLALNRVEEKFSLKASVTKWLEIYAA